jgi:hypothetical protein
MFRLDGTLTSQTTLGARGGAAGPGKELIESRNKVEHPYSTAEHEVNIIPRIRVHTSLVTCDRIQHGAWDITDILDRVKHCIPSLWVQNEIFNTFSTADGRER